MCTGGAAACIPQRRAAAHLAGVLGSATFSIIISFNETARTAGAGPFNTVPHLVAFPSGRADAADLRPDERDDLLTLALILGLLLGNLRRGRS